jgi:uncharacterized DUF497 family protein
MASETSMSWGRFVWDPQKERANRIRHRIDFRTASQVFLDPYRVIAHDEKHSVMEARLYCIGKTRAGIVTVRYTHRGEQIRIIGAGCWRKERKIYEKKKRDRS